MSKEQIAELIKNLSTLDDEKDNNLASVAIGGFTYGISPLEMAAAYATIANDGVYIKPTFYTKAVDSNGNTVLEPSQPTERVCSVQTAYIVKDLMKSVKEVTDTLSDEEIEDCFDPTYQIKNVDEVFKRVGLL